MLTREQEDQVVEYSIRIAQMFYGLPVGEFKRMVYSYAVACGSKAIPHAWEENRAASQDWYRAFMRRHPRLALKAPEGMSLARITAFNKVNVDVFFKAYISAVEKYEFQPHQIYNVDESALSTVMKPVKVICERGRPVASQTSRERGATMTFVGIINAMGQCLPPVFIIPRKRNNPAFMRGTSHGAKAILHPSGWMNGECFLETLQHIQKWTRCTSDNKILLIMDNAECHMNIHVVEYAMEHGIVIVTLPPHTTAKLQPLDVSVYGPFKTFLRSILNRYQIMNPHKHITEHMLPEFACDAWSQACTITNVTSGFRATGIWPINSHIFPDEAFLGTEVTERPNPVEPFVIEVEPHADDIDDLHLNEEHDSQGSPLSPLHEDNVPAARDGNDLSSSSQGDPAVAESPEAGPSHASFPAPSPSTRATEPPPPSTPHPAPTPSPSTPGPATPSPSTPGPATPSPSTPVPALMSPGMPQPSPSSSSGV